MIYSYNTYSSIRLKEHWHQLGGLILAPISIRFHCLDGAKTLSSSLTLSLLIHPPVPEGGERPGKLQTTRTDFSRLRHSNSSTGSSRDFSQPSRRIEPVITRFIRGCRTSDHFSSSFLGKAHVVTEYEHNLVLGASAPLNRHF